MGKLTITITGASGRLGASCVEIALQRGHEVRAITRQPDQTFDDRVSVIFADLADGLPEGALKGTDAIIHCAAAMSNDQEILARDTIKATSMLLEAATQTAQQANFVLASSLSVYDACAGANGAVLNESTELETKLHRREAYTRSKIIQEGLIQHSGLPAWILRIGAVYQNINDWNVHIGIRKAGILMSLSRTGDVPLSHLENTATALVLAAETKPESGREILNVVDDRLPTRAEFIAVADHRLHIPFFWQALLPLASVAELLLGERSPGLLRSRVLKARFRPLRFSNQRTKDRLNWAPKVRFTKGRRA